MLPSFHSLILDESMSVIYGSGLLIGSPITLRALVLLLNAAIIHKNEWEVRAGFSITTPQFFRGRCHTKRSNRLLVLHGL
jgi:hypothetical protein